MVHLAVDTGVLSGDVAALPLSWLDGLAIVPYRPRQPDWTDSALEKCDAILLRSVTKLDRAALQRLPNLRAVATLSSGTDHVDELALQQQGIGLHTGRGGNAHAVADWVDWGLSSQGVTPQEQGRILVVGVGAVGSAVLARLQMRGFRAIGCDPPRARLDANFCGMSWTQALQQPWLAVTLHVPLTGQGPDKTLDLLDESVLTGWPGAVVLQASRGGVLEQQAAAQLRRTGALRGLAVDTFVGEPQPDPAFVAACDRATPHIAGHSIEGKLRVAWLALDGLRRQFNLLPPGSLEVAVAEVLRRVDPPGATEAFSALDAADRALRLGPPGQFDALRHAHRRGEINL